MEQALIENPIPMWYKSGATKNFRHSFVSEVRKTLNLGSTLSNRTHLIYLSSLIEQDKKEEAKLAWNMYAKEYSELDVHKYLLVSKFVYENFETKNSKIKNTHDLFDLCTENREQYSLEKFIKGKSIAVIGNGPAHIGKNKGTEIDSHDIVIRINNFQTKGYKDDYGSKVDLWLKNGSWQIVHNRDDIADNIRILYEPDFEHYPLNYDYDVHMMKDAQKHKAFFFNYDEHTELRAILGKDPTSGMMMIYNIYKILGNLDNVDLYGFSFQSQNKSLGHYFIDKNQLNLATAHNLDNEGNLILQLKKEKHNG